MITYPTITYDDVNGYRGISHVESYNEDQRIGPLVPFLTGFVAGAPFGIDHHINQFHHIRTLSISLTHILIHSQSIDHANLTIVHLVQDGDNYQIIIHKCGLFF